MAVRVSLAAANIAGISFAVKSPPWVPNWPSHTEIDQKVHVFDPRHIEEYVRGDLPGSGEVPSMVRKVSHRKRRADELVGLLRYAWDRNLELVSELVRHTHEKELHSAASAALNVSTDVAKEAEGESGPPGSDAVGGVFFPFYTGRGQRCHPHGGHQRCSRHGHHGNGRPTLGRPSRSSSHSRHRAASGRRGRGHRLPGAVCCRSGNLGRSATRHRGASSAAGRGDGAGEASCGQGPRGHRDRAPAAEEAGSPPREGGSVDPWQTVCRAGAARSPVCSRHKMVRLGISCTK
ncbi:unnamed protein product [Ectocarpus sp. 4 AP-2014]